MVKSDGSLLDTYTVIPELGASVGTLEVDILDSGDSPVLNPYMEMDALDFNTSYQSSTGTFGISSQKIRVSNTTGTASWTLSIAPSGGATDYWDATTDFDYNDPTANAGDGADADSLGGQLTIDSSSATITPESGCSTTGLSLNSSASYSEGVVDSITIFSASSGADTGCYWDVTGIDISQTVPANQPADYYTIDLVLTIM